MAFTAFLYGKFIDTVLKKKIDFSADTFKVMLTTSSYTPNQDTHDFKDDITNEIAGTGYVAGGTALASVTLTYDGPSNTETVDAADTSWAGATFTARYAVLYDSTPATDATRPLVGYIDFGADQTVTGSTFTIVWDASGIVRIQVA